MAYHDSARLLHGVGNHEIHAAWQHYFVELLQTRNHADHLSHGVENSAAGVDVDARNKHSAIDWMNLVWLALLPTIVSTATLAIATRNIGATKASVMGVFEPVRQFS